MTDQELQQLIQQATAAGKLPSGEFLSKDANGNQVLWSRDENGNLVNEGVQTSKVAPAGKPIIQQLDDGSTWAITLDKDGNVASSTQIVTPGSSATASHLDAETAYTNQKIAEAQAMQPYNQGKASATIANLQSMIQQRTDLDPAKKKLLLSQADAAASRVGLNEANAAKAGAQTNLYTAEAQAKLQNSFWLAKNQVDTLMQTVGQPGGPTQEEADSLAKDIYARAAQEAASGLTAKQMSDQNLTAQRQAVEQANSRNTEALGYTKNAFDTVSNMATKGMAPGQGDIAAKGFLAMLNAGQGFSNATGGAPINIHPNAGNMPVTQDHIADIAKQVMGGTPFAQAVMNTASKSGAVTGGGPMNYNGVGDLKVQTQPMNGGFLQGLNGNAYDAAQDPNSPLYNPNDVPAGASA